MLGKEQLEKDLTALSVVVGDLLTQHKLCLSVAESCTGGWLAKVITDVPGSSKCFDRGFVTYSNAAKRDMLGVSDETLNQYGAVSEQTVREMAEGAIARSLGDLSVSISGIAGPEGGAADKPIGTVWLAWSYKSGQGGLITRISKYLFTGNRDHIRSESVKIALGGLVKVVQDLK